jgi:hypothetical protein
MEFLLTHQKLLFFAADTHHAASDTITHLKYYKFMHGVCGQMAPTYTRTPTQSTAGSLVTNEHHHHHHHHLKPEDGVGNPELLPRPASEQSPATHHQPHPDGIVQQGNRHLSRQQTNDLWGRVAGDEVTRS